MLEDKVELNADYIIISCHGEDGRIIMAKLHESMYLQDESKHDFSSTEIEMYIKLSNKIIINIGCSTGNKNMMDFFFKKHSTYIAPTHYVDGNAVFILAVNMFYSLARNIDVFTSFNKAKQLDNLRLTFVLKTSIITLSPNRLSGGPIVNGVNQ